MAKGKSVDFSTGAFGFLGTTIQCDAESTSFYCQTMKMFNLLMIFGFVAFLVYMFLRRK